jgi:hypothetical protein
MRSRLLKVCAVLCTTLWLGGCSIEAFRVTLDATETASQVFKEARDEPRIKRDELASRRLGELCAQNRLTAAEVQPLKHVVTRAKADGAVTLPEADEILIEMERIVALHRE